MKIISALSLSLLLTACGSYSGSFDCPIGEGLKCASLSEVNQKIDDGAINMGFPSEKSDATCQKVTWRSDLVQPKVHPWKGR
jgi:hypothetical protein